MKKLKFEVLKEKFVQRILFFYFFRFQYQDRMSSFLDET